MVVEELAELVAEPVELLLEGDGLGRRAEEALAVGVGVVDGVEVAEDVGAVEEGRVARGDVEVGDLMEEG